MIESFNAGMDLAIEDTHILKEYGFMLPRRHDAKSPEEAVKIAERFGYPVVLKVVSKNILHKTNVGGVRLSLHSPEDIHRAFFQIMESVKCFVPDAKIDALAVEEMYPAGIELFLGLENNAQFGPTITFGLGGIFIEVIRDVTTRVLPIKTADAAEMIGEIRGRRILTGFRGQEPVSKAMLIDRICAAGRLGLHLGDRLQAVDLNPILVWGEEHRVLDAKILVNDRSNPRREGEIDTAHLDKFFNPESVAVVGASAKTGKIGGDIFDSLINHEYKGHVYPVNAKHREILGYKAYASLDQVEGSIDLVVLAIPLKAAPAVIRQCAAKNVRAVVIVSGGGKELGHKGKALEDEILSLAKKNEIRIVGPNCIGVFNGRTRLDTFFQVHNRMMRPRAGSLAVLTQSGTVGATLLEYAAKIGISKFVSYGNRLDVDDADLIEYLCDDPETLVILCYIEGLDDGRKFLRAIRSAAQNKPVAVYKAGRSPDAAKASISHTGFFGGTFESWKGAFHQAGVIAVDSIEELFAAGKALCLQKPAKGWGVAMISNGAGPMVQAMDLMEDYGLKINHLSEQTLARMRTAFPSYFVVQNPVDVTGSATAHDYQTGIDSLLLDKGVNIVMPWFVFQDTALGEEIVEFLESISAKSEKPILCGASGGPYTCEMSERIEAKGIPVYQTVRDWVVAAAALARAGINRSCS